MSDAIAQMENAGLRIDGALEFGKLVRVAVDDDKGRKKSGWYIAHELSLDNGIVVIVGRYGNWKRYGDEALKIEFDLPPLSEEEKAKFVKRQQELRDQAEQEKQQRAADAAERAQRIFEKLPAGGKSDYLQRKKVRNFGIKFSRGSIVVPVRNANGDLVGLQFIDAEGGKKFLTGTPKRGCFHMLGEHHPPGFSEEEGAGDAPIAIAEGYATAATIHQATSWMVAVAFDAGNLLPVAQALHQQYPEREFIICADNDAQTEGNPGVTKATEAARAIGARLCIPDFSAIKARAA